MKERTWLKNVRRHRTTSTLSSWQKAVIIPTATRGHCQNSFFIKQTTNMVIFFFQQTETSEHQTTVCNIVALVSLDGYSKANAVRISSTHTR